MTYYRVKIIKGILSVTNAGHSATKIIATVSEVNEMRIWEIFHSLDLESVSHNIRYCYEQ